MIINKEKWLEEACYKLAFLEAMDGMFLVPDAQSLRTFLKKPKLLIKLAYKDHPDLYQDKMVEYDNFEKNKSSIITSSENLKTLNKLYAKGLTPDEAAIEITKWCDTPAEAGKFIASPNPMSLVVIMAIFLSITAVTLKLYSTLGDRLDLKNEVENSKLLYKNIVSFYENKGNITLDTNRVIKEGLVPENMPVVGEKIINIWDGEVIIKSSNINNLEITYTNVEPYNVCVDFLITEKKLEWNSVIINEHILINYKTIKNNDIYNVCQSQEPITITFKK